MSRGAKPGEYRGGRKKGTPNKRTADIQARLDKMGCDPIEGMARIAKDAMKAKNPNLALTAYKELAQYVAPKRKSVEMKAEIRDIDLSEELTEQQKENLKKVL